MLFRVIKSLNNCSILFPKTGAINILDGNKHLENIKQKISAVPLTPYR